MKRILLKFVVILAASSVLGYLFIRSARDVRSEPYDITRQRLAGWTLAIDAAPNPSGILLGLRPDKETAAMLFGAVFSRTGESLSGPVPAAMPLVLQREFEGARAGAVSAEALLASARAAGLESSAFEPRCMAGRRVSEPGIRRQVYFVRFDWPAFGAFRRQIARDLRAAGADGFDPDALSPVLIVAASDAAFGRWLPLRRDAQDDCLAPIVVK